MRRERSRREASDSYVSDLLCRNQLRQQRIASSRSLQRRFARGGKPVILTRRAIFSVGDGPPLPLRSNQPNPFHTAQCGIDGAARKTRDLHDRVAVNVPRADGLQDHRGRVGKLCCFWHGGSIPYVEFYVSTKR